MIATRIDAENDDVLVPQTLEEYCIKASSAMKNNDQNEDCILDDLGSI